VRVEAKIEQKLSPSLVARGLTVQVQLHRYQMVDLFLGVRNRGMVSLEQLKDEPGMRNIGHGLKRLYQWRRIH
jgi:hypothetical protein